MGSTSEIVTRPFEQAYGKGFNDMRDRQPDLSLLERLTGSRPTTSLKEILRDAIAYFRQVGDPDAED